MLVPGGQYKGPLLLQAAAQEMGDGAAVECIGADGAYTVLAVQVSGTDGDTITFEGSQDGTNWEAVQFTALATGTAATTAEDDGIYRATVLGLRQVRARISNWNAGTISVTGWLVA